MVFSLKSFVNLDKDLLVFANIIEPLTGLSILCGRPTKTLPGLLYFFFKKSFVKSMSDLSPVLSP